MSPESSLYKKLCNPDESSKCQFANTVTLDTNLPCHNRECRVDEIVIIQVAPGAFYEYIRLPCVQLSFYNDAKKVVTGYSDVVSGIGRRHTHGMCANPLIASAARSCCDIEAIDVAEYNYKMDITAKGLFLRPIQLSVWWTVDVYVTRTASSPTIP